MQLEHALPGVRAYVRASTGPEQNNQISTTRHRQYRNRCFASPSPSRQFLISFAAAVILIVCCNNGLNRLAPGGLDVSLAGGVPVWCWRCRALLLAGSSWGVTVVKVCYPV